VVTELKGLPPLTSARKKKEEKKNNSKTVGRCGEYLLMTEPFKSLKQRYIGFDQKTSN